MRKVVALILLALLLLSGEVMALADTTTTVVIFDQEESEVHKWDVIEVTHTEEQTIFEFWKNGEPIAETSVDGKWYITNSSMHPVPLLILSGDSLAEVYFGICELVTDQFDRIESWNDNVVTIIEKDGNKIIHGME